MIEERRILRVRRRIAAPAPMPKHEETAQEKYQKKALEHYIDQMATDWASWAVTRKYYGRPPAPSSVLAQFGKPHLRSTAPGLGPNASASSVLARFHQAVVSQETLARWAFEGYYLYRVRPIKKLAHLLSVDRTHVYWLRNQYARYCYSRTTK